tara:strand:+ start:38 stop:913 length:876 start_codon:yes stop_codon:yes gene_type:complete
MTNSIAVIKEKLLKSSLLTQTLGKGKEKYISSVLAEINKTIGTDQDISICTLNSIVECIKQACDLNLEIDGRQHCHLLKYGKKATLRVGYRGLIYAIKRAYPDANIDCGLVYKDDKFTVKKNGDLTTYSLERNNPFADKKDIIGGFCYISYSLAGKQISFCETMSIEEINRAKSVAKTTTIWNQWFEEKARVVVIRRACKHHFSGINENIAKIEEFDNQEFDFKESESNEKIIEAESINTISSEQGIELVKLIEEKGRSVKDIEDIYDLKSIIYLPLEKFDNLKKSLNENN